VVLSFGAREPTSHTAGIDRNSRAEQGLGNHGRT
jgi:hypothetical protein